MLLIEFNMYPAKAASATSVYSDVFLKLLVIAVDKAFLSVLAIAFS